jgi:uncharacterized iron-regulated membrane protein
MHQTLLVLHRWIALVATLLILIVAITGSALVFEGAMDRGMHPELWRVTPRPSRASLDSLIAHAGAAVPDAKVSGITMSPAPDRAWVAQVGASQVFVDPYTGAVLGHRTLAEWNQSLPRRLHVLHVSLMAGKRGSAVVGAISVLSLLLVVLGVVIWWRDKAWRVRWSASWKRVLFDLHHALGVGAAVVIAAIAISGMAIHYEPLNRWIYSLDRTSPPEPAKPPAATAGARSISADSLYRVATATLPGANVMFLSLSAAAGQPFVAALRYPEDHTPAGRSRVFVDRNTGAVLLATSTRQAQLGTRLGNVVRSVHTGDVLGKPTEMIWLAAAIVLAMQGVTGVSMWWNGRPARAALKRARGVVSRQRGIHNPVIPS